MITAYFRTGDDGDVFLSFNCSPDEVDPNPTALLFYSSSISMVGQWSIANNTPPSHPIAIQKQERRGASCYVAHPPREDSRLRTARCYHIEDSDSSVKSCQEIANLIWARKGLNGPEKRIV